MWLGFNTCHVIHWIHDTSRKIALPYTTRKIIQFSGRQCNYITEKSTLEGNFIPHTRISYNINAPSMEEGITTSPQTRCGLASTHAMLFIRFMIQVGKLPSHTPLRKLFNLVAGSAITLQKKSTLEDNFIPHTHE